jgi:hypothetical protein
MTETTIPITTDRRRSRAGVAALSLAAGAVLGIAGTVLATPNDDHSARPTIVERSAVDQAQSDDDTGESSCRLRSADAAERCVADRVEAACHLLSADAAERCLADRAGQG